MMGLVAKYRKVRLHLAEEDLTYNPAVFLFIVEMLQVSDSQWAVPNSQFSVPSG